MIKIISKKEYEKLKNIEHRYNIMKGTEYEYVIGGRSYKARLLLQSKEMLVKTLLDMRNMILQLQRKFKESDKDVRVEREKENSRKLENKLSEKQEKIKELNEIINDCIIREKKAQYTIENVKETITSEFKENLINVINKQKGHLSKVKVVKLVEET